MLANGSKLSYKEHGTESATYTELTGFQEFPEWGSDPEKVETTDLSNIMKTYEYGIGDSGEKEFKFVVKDEKMTSTSQIAVLKAFELAKTVLDFKHEFKDGTTVTFSGQISIKTSAGQINSVVGYTMKVVLSEEEEYNWATE